MWHKIFATQEKIMIDILMVAANAAAGKVFYNNHTDDNRTIATLEKAKFVRRSSGMNGHGDSYSMFTVIVPLLLYIENVAFVEGEVYHRE